MVQEKELLTFEVGEERFLMDIKEISEIYPYQTPFKIPGTPDFFEGVVLIRDILYGVVRLKGTYEMGKDSFFIAMADPDERLAFHVQKVSEIVKIPEDVWNERRIREGERWYYEEEGVRYQYLELQEFKDILKKRKEERS